MAGMKAWGWVLHALAWETGRQWRALRRRLGAAGMVTLALLAVAGLSVWVDHRALHDKARAQEALALIAHRPAVSQAAPATSGDSARLRLAAFDRQLLTHEDIPQAIGDLLTLAEQEGLAVEKGEYRPQPDAPGGFLRYRMTWPVKGDAAAVRRFILSALRAQPSLALESIQFKRESAAGAAVEARIQWLLLTQPSQRPVSGALESARVATGASR